MGKKLLNFKASISDVKQINPLFSTCKVRVLYTGKNRNMSIITRDAVNKALPTLSNVPIVGEFSEERDDFKGHGGAIDLDDYRFIHTTKPYGVVPESATYEWEEVNGKEYLTIDGCYLWTGRYEEAYTVIEKGKSQSMEIEVTDGTWVEDENAYRIDSFIFSALCILGDDVEPAFEDASITAYSLDKNSFRKEFSQMLKELKFSLSKEENQEKEVDGMLKKLLEKYSLTVEQLTEKGINFNEISEDELEAKIIEVFEIEVDAPNADAGDTQLDGEDNDTPQDEPQDEPVGDEGEITPEGEIQPENNSVADNEEDNEPNVDFEALQNRITQLENDNQILTTEVESLREFKINVEKREHEAKVQELFTNFQLSELDVEGLDIHAFSLGEIEEKCYAILGRKLASKKNFTKSKNEGIRINIEDNQEDEQPKPYGGLFEKYNKKD